MSEIWTHVRDPEIRENFACGIGNPSVLNSGTFTEGN